MKLDFPSDEGLSYIIVALSRPDDEPQIMVIPFEPEIAMAQALALASESMTGVEFPA